MNEKYYSLIPFDYMEEGMRQWIEHGIRPGSFLMAVLENDLMRAVSNADASNRLALYEWCDWLYNYPPSSCWGSIEKCNAWADHRGLKGGEDAPQDETS